ncbi:MAG: hypothetical protein HY720_32665 [Planctomycetes bacterium]|nr:hypothetical protein [Planctomycetota bacterium]
MDLEDAKKFCQVGIDKGFFGVEDVKKALDILRERMKLDPDASVESILIEEGALDAAEARTILREMAEAISPRRPAPRPPPPPAGPPAEEEEDDLELEISGGAMRLDAEELSASAEMFALDEEKTEESESIEEVPGWEAESSPRASEASFEKPRPDFEEEPEPAEEEDIEEEDVPRERSAAPVSAKPPPRREEEKAVPPTQPRPETPRKETAAPGSSEALAAAGVAREAIDRATQGSLLTADDFFRCLNLAFRKEKVAYTLAGFVAIAVLTYFLTGLGARAGGITHTISLALTGLFSLVLFLALTGVLARSTQVELDGGKPLGPKESLDYLKKNWLTLLASPAIFLFALGIAVSLAVGLLFILGLIPKLGPILFGLLTLVVFGIFLAAFVVTFLGLLVIPAAVAVEGKDPIGTVKSVWERVRKRPVPLLFTEVLAFLFISIVTFALATVIAIPLAGTNLLEARILETEPSRNLVQTPADSVFVSANQVEVEEKEGFDAFCYKLAEWLYRLSIAIVLAAVLAVPYIFIAVLQVPAYRALA